MNSVGSTGNGGFRGSINGGVQGSETGTGATSSQEDELRQIAASLQQLTARLEESTSGSHLAKPMAQRAAVKPIKIDISKILWDNRTDYPEEISSFTERDQAIIKEYWSNRNIYEHQLQGMLEEVSSKHRAFPVLIPMALSNLREKMNTKTRIKYMKLLTQTRETDFKNIHDLMENIKTLNVMLIDMNKDIESETSSTDTDNTYLGSVATSVKTNLKSLGSLFFGS